MGRLRNGKHVGYFLFVVLLALILVQMLLTADTSRGHIDAKTGTSVVVSEIAPRNTCIIPDSQGKFTDYVELYNPTDAVIDLGGIGMGDGEDAPRFVFAKDTLLAPDEAMVVFCDGFRLSAAEQLVLFDVAGDPFLTLDILQTSGNEVMYLQDEIYTLTFAPSPGYPNDAQGEENYAQSRRSDIPLSINEVCIDTILDADGEWVELCNTSDTTQVYSGIHLSDRMQDLFCYPLADFTLEAGQVQLVHLSGFLLKAGETLYVSDAQAKHVDSIVLQETQIEQTQNAEGILAFATPDYPNTQEGVRAYLSEKEYTLVISEVMSDNNDYLRGPYGTTHDYIELYNAGDETLHLSEYSIIDGVGKEPIQLPDMELQAGECIVFLAEKDGIRFLAGYPTLDMSVSSAGEILILYHENTACDVLHVPRLEQNQVFGRDGEMLPQILSTPSIGTFE